MKADENRFDNDGEIDLREILKLIFRQWRWIAAATILSAAVALGISLLLPKQYRASAAVALTKPEVVLRFDPRTTTEVEVPGGKGIPELALGDSVLQQVLDSPAGETMDSRDRRVDEFRENLEASLSETVLSLTVEDRDAARVAVLANTWAEKVVGLLNDVYAPSSRSQGFFEDQAEESLSRWKSSQQELIDFQAINPETILEQRLTAQEAALANYLDTYQAFGLVLLDAGALRERLEDRAPADGVSLGDDLASLLLTAQSLSAARGSTPLELQVVAQSDSSLGESPGQLARYVGELIDSLEAQQVALMQEAAGLESEIHELQGRLAKAQEERALLEQERSLAQEAYEALARKAQETRLAAEDEERVARVASRAVGPSKYVRPHVLLSTALGGTLGSILGLAWVLVPRWWLAGYQTAKSD